MPGSDRYRKRYALDVPRLGGESRRERSLGSLRGSLVGDARLVDEKMLVHLGCAVEMNWLRKISIQNREINRKRRTEKGVQHVRDLS